MEEVRIHKSLIERVEHKETANLYPIQLQIWSKVSFAVLS